MTTVLFDGSCRFCVESTRRLRRFVTPGGVRFLDFNSPGVLESFPSITRDACRAGVQVIAPDGRVFAGAEGIARLLSTRPILSPLAALYFLPGLRSLWDRAYTLVARNRYRIRGSVGAEPCPSGTCPIHQPSPSPRTRP